MASQLRREENFWDDGVDSLKIWKVLIDRYLEGEERAAEIRELEILVKRYCEMDFDASKSSEVLKELYDYFRDDSKDHTIDVVAFYKERLASRRGALNDNYAQQRIWKEVFVDNDADLDVEEIAQMSLATEETEYEEMQDSIFYSNVFTPPVDPISKMVIQEPYKNKSCGHIYDYKFIMQYIKSMKNKAKCPYIGCGNSNITMAQLVEDKDTQEKIKNYHKTKTSQSSEDSNEDD